ncbi:uncharacterized protein LOC118419796 [Branchiostoma floridae]|uniref:Uncharacterized protein LOC118419796 n=1 Tax=Branchiostoma floridae TaxID=7739 RepID=C3XWA9_BRAFL|nr:uncharacterized protein LOC118419796 [Branchiostoma floridae]|eukprot:XP_002611633.1 hypothetical protein BRAFLDRAFT_117131 [Branchiostoma floridae]
MAENGANAKRKSAAELRLEQLQKWREARGRQHRPGREPLTPGIVKLTGTSKANLPPSRGSSVKKSSAVKRKQKENTVQEDSYLERFEQWRSEKKKKQERESASKRPPWRPFSAGKTNLLSQPLTRCCNHDHGAGAGARKKLAMDAGAAAAGGDVQNNAEVQDNQEVPLHDEDMQPHLNDMQDNQELLHVENAENLQPHPVDIQHDQERHIENYEDVRDQAELNNIQHNQEHDDNGDVQSHLNIQDNQEVMPHNDMDNIEELQPHVNNIEENQDNTEQLALLGNQDDLEVIPHLGYLENPQGVLQPLEDNQGNPEPGKGNIEDNSEPLDDSLDNPDINTSVQDGQDDVEVTPVEPEQEDRAQPDHMATDGNVRQDIQHVTLVEQDTELSGPGAGEHLTDNTVALPHHLSAMLDVSETEGQANTAVTPFLNDLDEDLNAENISDSQEDDDDSDIMEAAVAIPKKMSMRQKLDQWLKEKGKTPSRFNSILTFRTPAPGSARRSLRKRRSAAPFWPGLGDAGKDEEDAGKDAVTLQLEAIFQECMAAIDEGYSSVNIAGILDTVYSCIPQCVQHSQYWLCRARLAQLQRDDHRVVSMFEMAVAAHAEPYEDIKDALTAFVLRKEAEQPRETPEDDGIEHVRPSALFKTPKRRSAFARLDQGAAFDSSMKMYSVTPLFRRARGVLRKAAPVPVATVAPIVVTPVRRSARIRRASALHPPELREHDPLVPSLADVSEEEFVLRANRALVRETPMVDGDAD